MQFVQHTLAALLCCAVTISAADRPSVFIAGTGRGAYDARKKAQKAKCFVMAVRPDAADATLEVSETIRYAFHLDQRGIVPSDAAALLTGADGTSLWQGASMFGADKIVVTLDREICRGTLAIHRK